MSIKNTSVNATNMNVATVQLELARIKKNLKVNLFVTFVVIFMLFTNILNFTKTRSMTHIILSIVMLGLTFMLFNSRRKLSDRRRQLEAVAKPD